MDAGGGGVSGPAVEFLFQRLNLLRRPQEANSCPVFPSDKISGPDRGPEMIDPAGSSAALAAITFREPLWPPTG